jgi:hypothetical protein
MARIEQGNDLASPILQPGWSLTYDGYGLVTLKARYASNELDVISDVTIGEQFSSAVWGTLAYRCQKVNYTIDKLGISYADAEFVGLQSGLTVTRPNITGSSGLTSEHITTHPEFFTASTGIAGAKPFTASSILGPNGTTLYKGLNGAHFQDPEGGKFVGFLDPTYPLYYGKSHYLAPVTSFSGVIYTSSSANVTTLRNAVGKTSSTNAFGGITLLPSYVGTSFTISGRNQLLLSQVNFEDYAVTAGGTAYVFKINYEIRYNREGYVSPVYSAA